MSSSGSESDNNAFWYDKVEFYAEYGLAKGNKRDSKSRSMKEREKAEKRKKNVDGNVSALPNKMQKKVDHIVSNLPNKMQKKVAQLISTLPNEMQKKEKVFVKQGKSKKITNSVNIARQNTSEDVSYNDYYDYEEAFEEEPSEEEPSEEEPSEEEPSEEEDDNYKFGLKMWLKYGLTKKQYDDYLEHCANIHALDAFEADPENYHAPEYGEMLRQKIKAFQDDIDAQEKDRSLKYPDYPDQECFYNDDQEYCYDDEFIEYEDDADIAERYREERMESAIENARDDMRDY